MKADFNSLSNAFALGMQEGMELSYFGYTHESDQDRNEAYDRGFNYGEELLCAF